MVNSFHIFYRWLMRIGALSSMALMVAGLILAHTGSTSVGQSFIQSAIFILFLTPISALVVFLAQSIQTRNMKLSLLIVLLCAMLIGGIWMAGLV